MWGKLKIRARGSCLVALIIWLGIAAFISGAFYLLLNHFGYQEHILDITPPGFPT